MDTEYESTSYLKYFNDTETPNSYLLSNNEDGLNDSFSVEPIFTEIGTTDWPSEGLSVLLSNPLINQECTESSSVSETNVSLLKTEQAHSEPPTEEMQVDNSEQVSEKIRSENIVSLLNFTTDKRTIQTTLEPKLYINYSPIVKENADGNKEIYLTEKDINNDASVIQLLNTDGSIITLDKSILSSLNLPSTREGPKKTELNFEQYFTSVTAHKCKICQFLCESVLDMKKHLRENHLQQFLKETGKQKIIQAPQNKSVSILNKLNEDGNADVKKEYTIFVCSICKDVCSDRDAIREHMIQKHKMTNDETTEPGKTAEKTVEHKKTQNLSKYSVIIKKQQKSLHKIKCTVAGCPLSFANEETREKHEKCHIGENRKQFKCLKCDEKFSIWRICSNHLWKEHKMDLGLISCPICYNFKSNSPGRVINHMAIHNEEKPFLCALCGKGFKTLSQLKNHEAIHKSPENMPSWSTMKKCDICERYFANSKCLKKHVQSVHENFKPFICNICGHKTSRKAMLELHLRQHTGAKPHTCPYCEYRTGDHNCLRKHVMKHMGTHKYKCPHCTYTCIQTASLKSHITNKHPGQSGTYNCKYCSYTTINAAAHSAHEKCHENNLKENGSASCTNATIAIKTSMHSYIQAENEEEETQNCFLQTEHSMEDTVDTGGITIPAGFEMQLVS